MAEVVRPDHAPTVQAMTQNSLVVIDGNSLAHRAYHARAATAAHTPDGRPVWAVQGFLTQLIDVTNRLHPTALVVGFDDPHRNLRKEKWPEYKAGRKAKPEDLEPQIHLIIELLRQLGVHTIVPEGYEADDVLASAAREAASLGWPCTLVTSDRDAFALIDTNTRVLRIINGGVDSSPLLTADLLPVLCGVRPDQYRMYAAVRGDASDNLPGITGIGEKTAAKMLAAFDTVEAAFADLDAGGQRVRAELGAGVAGKLARADRSVYEKNLQIMTMVDSLTQGTANSVRQATLPIPAAVHDCLAPLGLQFLRHAIARALGDAGDLSPAQVPASSVATARAQVPAPRTTTAQPPASVSADGGSIYSSPRPAYSPKAPRKPTAWSSTLL